MIFSSKRLMEIGFLALVLGLSSCRFFSCERSQSQAIAIPQKTIFSFLGAPGVGKGTLSEKCVKDLGFIAVSTGDLCRAEISRGSEKGKMISQYSREGRLVPDEVVTEMVQDWLGKQKGDKPIILDGYPRTAEQAEFLSKMLKNKFPQFKLRVVSLDISDYEPIVKRITDRLVCEKCKRIHNRILMKDPDQKTCEVCGGKLVQREDDREDKVRRRLADFDKNNQEIVDYYKKVNIPIEGISAAHVTPHQLFENFKEHLKK